MSEKCAIVWLKNELRLADNPALHAAAQSGLPLVLVYIHPEHQGQEHLVVRPLGAAQKWWLHQNLLALQQQLQSQGNNLNFIAADPLNWFDRMASAGKLVKLFFNRSHDPALIPIENQIISSLDQKGIKSETFQGNLLHDPEKLKTGSGTPFRVFTPFWKAFRNHVSVPEPLKPPKFTTINNMELPDAAEFESLQLCPEKPNWSAKMQSHWAGGEKAAQERFSKFLDTMLSDYADGRDIPASDKTSKMSAYLRFGTVSPAQLWHGAMTALHENKASQNNVETFLKELVWREFSYHLLWHFPQLATRNFNQNFDYFPWQHNSRLLDAWKRGKTGIPLIDAGMRQLWQTGWMHNRVRMVTASFLVKHMLINWREGEDWFWDTLVDGDPASNPASWQWVAGSGADAAPYFRVFNPVLQSQKFDPAGIYIRHYLPELEHLDKKQIHLPTNFAVIGLEEGRNRALLAYNTMKNSLIAQQLA